MISKSPIHQTSVAVPLVKWVGAIRSPFDSVPSVQQGGAYHTWLGCRCQSQSCCPHSLLSTRRRDLYHQIVFSWRTRVWHCVIAEIFNDIRQDVLVPWGTGSCAKTSFWCVRSRSFWRVCGCCLKLSKVRTTGVGLLIQVWTISPLWIVFYQASDQGEVTTWSS